MIDDALIGRDLTPLESLRLGERRPTLRMSMGLRLADLAHRMFFGSHWTQVLSWNVTLAALLTEAQRS